MLNHLQAGIEKLKIKGRAQVTFNPLIQRLPVIAAVKVCLHPTALLFVSVAYQHKWQWSPQRTSLRQLKP